MSTDIPGRDFDCGRLKEMLPDYLDRTLRDEICREIRAHLDDCENCRIFVDTIETTIVLYKHYPDSDVPEEVRINLRESIRIRSQKKK